MNTLDILKFGHLTVLKSIETIPDNKWDTPGVCGDWSPKEIVGHLSMFEQILADVIKGIKAGKDTPWLEKYLANPDEFNNLVSTRYRENNFREVLKEYVMTNEQVMDLAKNITREMWQKNGTIPWYGNEYCLDDFIVYQYYGHKREHTAQIDIFTSKLI